MEEMKLSEKEKDFVKKEVFKVESEFLRLTRKKISIKDFESLSIIGRGAFGEVRICREKASGDIVAIKKMRKEDMFQKNQVLHVRTEREIMITSNNPWVVSLKYSFQDDLYLYLVMDFLPGGDLMSLLIKKDIFTEDEARFYIAEIVLAIEALHNMGCIHRDLKPDNILIDKTGHIKLSDFGLSKLSDTKIFPLSSAIQEKNESKNNSKLVDDNHKINLNYKPSRKMFFKLEEEIKIKRKDRILAYSTVGTPDYIAPEVFGQTGYGPEVDWWSVGVILFEMLVGFPPFFSENPGDTCQKIVRWRKFFSIPSDSNLSIESENLIRKLIASPENRLGSYGVEAIKNHPFFIGVDWKNLRKYSAPFIPELSSDYDNRYFDRFDEEEPFYPNNPRPKKKGAKDNAFFNYTYKKENEKMKKNGFQHAMEVMDVIKILQNNEKEVPQENNMKPDIVVRETRRNTANSKQNLELTHNSSSSYNQIGSRNSSNQTPRIIEIKTEDRRSIISKEKVEKSNSPDSKLDTNSNSSSNQAVKFSGKMKIPLKTNINPLKKAEIPYPKLKESFKEKKMFLTPRENKDQLILKENHPSSSKNSSSNKITFEKNKYAQKIYEDIKAMKHNSQSPSNKEYNNGSLSSRSSDIYKKNKIS